MTSHDMKKFSWLTRSAKTICKTSTEQALAHQQQLTKPVGSLGKLEGLAVLFAGFQSNTKPTINKKYVRIFAGDHGIAAQGISAFSQDVTAQMIHNFLHGGAAISVLSQQHNADFHVFNMGLIDSGAGQALKAHPLLTQAQAGQGTADLSQTCALTYQQLEHCLTTGAHCVSNIEPNNSIFMGGEMGIGNTTSASALYSVFLSLPPIQTAGPGTGVCDEKITQKAQLIDTALSLHKPNKAKPFDVLQALGGFEIAALVGAFITCAQRGIPILVDGFITTAAALVATHINPSIKPWFIFSHCSAEPAHQLALAYFKQTPLLDLQLRLGEGSGAAVALPIIETALNLHNNMATFASAGVSDA